MINALPVLRYDGDSVIAQYPVNRMVPVRIERPVRPCNRMTLRSHKRGYCRHSAAADPGEEDSFQLITVHGTLYFN
jgi:hypothetical protein